ncbi:MAG TPA: serine protease [Thermoleophilaceae bacterium]|nr:serine protease [Thermoleophilaceae bacterium]
MLALAALALVLALAPVARAGISPKIVHGADASATDFPFQALLYTAGGTPVSTDPTDGADRICGGVIIDETHVITAAHCVYDVFRANQASSPGDYSVAVGTADLTDNTNTQVSSVSALSFDPRYDPNTNVHDVAVLTLSDPLTPSPTVEPIDILDAGTFDLLPDGTTFTVSGWGDMTPEPADGSGTPTFSNTLQAVDIPLVNNDTCVNEYAAQGVTVDPTLLFCAGDGTIPDTIPDSCQGDSGGPVVYDTDSPNKAYKLVGLVDSGIGCAQQGFPGIYTRIAEDDVKNFLSPLPPPAPVETGKVTIAGGSNPGQTLTCDAGGWTPTDANAPTFTYQFLRQGSSTPIGTGSTYTIQQSDLGSRILCEVKAQNTGGYGFADSPSVLVPIPPVVPPPPPPPPPAKDSTAPSLRISHKACTKTKCTVKVHVSDASPSSGIAKVKATLSFKRKTRCRVKHSRKTRPCTKRVHRNLSAKAGSGGTYTIVATHLKPNTSYVITLVPFDKAGNRPSFSTVTNLRTQPKHPRLF